MHGDPTLVPGAARRAAHTVVWITGDVLISEGMRRVIEGEAALEGTEADAYTRILAPVAEWFARDPESFVFANLESPVATRRNTIDRSTWGARGSWPSRSTCPPMCSRDCAAQGSTA